MHFLLEVDMEKAIETRLNVSEGEVKSLLRKERVRYRSLPNLKDAVQLASPIRKTLSAAQSLIRKNFTDFELTTSERNGQFVLRLTLTEAKLAEIREYSIKQNLTTVRNRVNELASPSRWCSARGQPHRGRTAGRTGHCRSQAHSRQDGQSRVPPCGRVRCAARLDRNLRVPRGRPPARAAERTLIITGDQVTDAQASYDETAARR